MDLQLTARVHIIFLENSNFELTPFPRLIAMDRYVSISFENLDHQFEGSEVRAQMRRKGEVFSRETMQL